MRRVSLTWAPREGAPALLPTIVRIPDTIPDGDVLDWLNTRFWVVDEGLRVESWREIIYVDGVGDMLVPTPEETQALLDAFGLFRTALKGTARSMEKLAQGIWNSPMLVATRRYEACRIGLHERTRARLAANERPYR